MAYMPHNVRNTIYDSTPIFSGCRHNIPVFVVSFFVVCVSLLLSSCGNDDTQNATQNTSDIKSDRVIDSTEHSTSVDAVTNWHDWEDVLAKAKGQSVLFNAWGGSDVINTYFAWVSEVVANRYDITLTHIKVGDIATTVHRILGEFAAGKRSDNGSVDLLWINGENFHSMKKNNLLFGPFVQFLPNISLLDTNKHVLWVDFGEPTGGYESPLGSAQFVVIFNNKYVHQPPQSVRELLTWAQQNPGRFTYPKPPNYIGTTFLKHVLYEVMPDKKLLLAPVTDESFADIEPAMWEIVDAFHKVAWNKGTSFPNNHQDQFRLLHDKEVDFAFSFSPGEASANVAQGTLPESVRTMIFIDGTIGNTHFVAIPANARSKEAAMVVANFLLSPEAQVRKQHPDHWGDFTVLDVNSVDDEKKAAFARIPRNTATLRPQDLFPVLAEPHASWVRKIEQAWQERYL